MNNPPLYDGCERAAEVLRYGEHVTIDRRYMLPFASAELLVNAEIIAKHTRAREMHAALVSVLETLADTDKTKEERAYEAAKIIEQALAGSKGTK